MSLVGALLILVIGEQTTKDFAAQKLNNVLILYTTIEDKNIKLQCRYEHDI